MNIIILGAGQVGGTLAENLVREVNGITVVDGNEDLLWGLQNRLDIRTILGEGSHPSVLSDAGADEADMLIAVTSNDEINIVACQVAYTLFKNPIKIARIRSAKYLAYEKLFDNKAIPIDVCISPEQLVTNYVQRIIQHPGALQVLDFAEGRVQLVVFRPSIGGPLVGKMLSSYNDYMPGLKMQITAVYRNNRPIELTSESVVDAGDEVFVIAPKENIQTIMSAFGKSVQSNKRMIIAGGGHIGIRLARQLENDFQVKLIDHNTKRTQSIASTLNRTTVLLGEASDRELLSDENIEYTDVFCAVTNDDEANIVAALQAKRLGARTVMALMNRTTYIDLLEGSNIDIAISPQQATISGILAYLRQSDMVNAYSLRRGDAEAIEIIAHGDKNTSNIVGRTLKEIKFPHGVQLGAIVRGKDTLLPDSEIVIAPDDRVILFLAEKKN